jgi:subtilisin family serine protease
MRAIKADQAWNKGRLGSPNVTVAILDSGIDPTHPDLQGRVDASRSTSFVPSDNALVATHFPGAQPWTDLRYHGTHVAATVSSNAFAAAGVTSKVPLMAVKVLDVNGKGTDGAVLGGIIHAAGKGADVINMSLGGEFLKRESHDVSADTPSSLVSTINRAINYANKKGTTIVVSAGNDAANMNEGSNLYRMFCESPHVVCVSATGPTSQESVNGRWFDIDSPASYSNYGSPVTVAAPGGNGTSSVWAACSKTMLQAVKNDKGEVSWIYPCRNGTFVLGLRGTSMAAPHTSGLAALLVEDIGKGQPSQVAARIRDSAEDLGDPDKDAFYGHGRINVIRALAPEGT